MDGKAAPDIVLAETPAQVAAAQSLFIEYQKWLGLDLCFQGFPEELATLPGTYAAPSGRLLLAQHDGAYVGCVALRALADAGRCEMKRLYVQPAAQGMGLGRALATRVIAEAKVTGYTAMYLDTLEHMHSAIGLYQSLGFKDVAPYRYNPAAEARYMALQLARSG
jgi:ribosomal protein S18 acetylase RimI-like enzyme